MTELTSRSFHPSQLIYTVLEDAQLLGALTHLSGREVHQLVRISGIEEAGALFPLLKPSQLMELAYEDLWKVPVPSEDEEFDVHRLHEWFAVLSELGPKEAARVVMEMSDEFVLFAFSQMMYVFDVGFMSMQMENLHTDVSQDIEKLLESHHCNELDHWLLVFNGGYGWGDSPRHSG